MKKIAIRSVTFSEYCTLIAYATNDRLVIAKHFRYPTLKEESCNVVKFNKSAYNIDVDIIPNDVDGGLVSEKSGAGWVTLDDFTAILKALNS